MKLQNLWYHSILSSNKMSSESKQTTIKGKPHVLSNKDVLYSQLKKVKTVLSSNHFSQIAYSYNKGCKQNNVMNLKYLEEYTNKILKHFFNSSSCLTGHDIVKTTKKPNKENNISLFKSLISKGIYKHSATSLDILVYIYNNNNNNNKNETIKENKLLTLIQSKEQSVRCFAIKNLSDYLSEIYAKPVRIRIITLKYPHLNVDIFSQYIKQYAFSNKSKSQKNFVSFYNKKFSKFKIFKLAKFNLRETWRNFYRKKLQLLSKTLLHKDSIVKTREFLSFIPYQFISGIKVELRGRFSKRRSSARTRALLRKKGTFKNLYSSYADFSINPKSGYANANISKGNVIAKSRNGRFNLKFQIASY